MFYRFHRAMKYLRKGHRGEEGMTGLETAIILIAFVTVAAVFGYAVLSAGLFSAERSKETVYAGLDQTKSSIEISGSVIATDNNNDQKVNEVKFTVKNSIAGNPIDMTPNDGTEDAKNRVVISVRTAKAYENNVKWTLEAIGNDDGDTILEPGEQFEITLDMGEILGEDHPLKANDTFAIQLKPEIGAAATIERTLPASIDAVMDLF